MRFKAFISYKHRASTRFAENLELAIKAYAKPIWQPPMRIFRDEKYLRPGVDLPELIRGVLEDSAFLVYLASPDAARSKWVQDELEFWCCNDVRLQRLIVVLTEGSIVEDPETKLVDWQRTDALPKTLAKKIVFVPFYVDLSWVSGEEHQSLLNPDYKKAINLIVAALRNVDPIELSGTEILQYRRNVRIRNTFIASIIALSIGLAFVANFAWNQMRLSQSRELAALSEQNAGRDPLSALHQAYEAVERGTTLEAERALWLATTVQNTTHLLTHGSSVTHAILSSDGATLFSTDEDGVLRIWDVGSGRLTREQVGHQGAIYAVALSNNGDRLVTGGADGKVQLWQLSRNSSPSIVIEHEDAVLGVALSPNGHYVASVGEDGTTRLRDLQAVESATILVRDDAMMRDVEFSPKGDALISVGDAEVSRVWGVPAFQLRYALPVSALRATFSPDGERILTISESRGGALWDAGTGALVCEAHEQDSVYHGSFSPTRPEFVTAGQGGITRVWQADTCSEIGLLPGHENIVRQATYSPDGRYIATASEDTTARIWSVVEHRELDVFRGHAGRVVAVSFAPNGQNLVTASDDRTVRIWSAHMPRAMFRLEYGAEFGTQFLSQHTALLSQRGKELLLLNRRGRTTARDIQDGRTIAHDLPSDCKLAVFTPDGSQILFACARGALYLWDARSWAPLHELKGHTKSILRASFSSDGESVITASVDGTSRIWSAQTGRLIRTLDSHEGAVVDAAFLRGGNRVATVDEGGAIRIWDIDTGFIVYTHESTRVWPLVALGGREMIRHALSKNGARAIYPGDGKALVVWDLHSRVQVDILEGVGWPVALSQDGRLVVAAAANMEDGTVHLRDTETKTSRLLRGHQDTLLSAEFAADHRRVLTRSADGTVRVWDVETGAEIYTYAGHLSTVGDAHFSTDGSLVVTLDGEGVVRVFPADIAVLRKFAETRRVD